MDVFFAGHLKVLGDVFGHSSSGILWFVIEAQVSAPAFQCSGPTRQAFSSVYRSSPLSSRGAKQLKAPLPEAAALHDAALLQRR